MNTISCRRPGLQPRRSAALKGRPTSIARLSTIALVLLTTFGVAATADVTSEQTPAQCLADVRAYVTRRAQELRPMTSETSAKLMGEQTAKLKDCVARFDVKTVAEKDLAGLADLYSAAGQLDLAKAAVARAMSATGLADADRAPLVVQSIRLMLREPKGDERNARLERLVDDLDKLPDAAALDAKFNAHQSMNGYYRADDIDAGIIKHSTWLIDTGKSLTPDLRRKYGPMIISAYVNMAEAWAGHGRTDDAIALLKRAPAEWPEVPTAANRIESTLARYLLVGTAGAPITASRWLNMPAGTTKLDMTGHVTLLEFTAHWCGPCKESYPGINRLRERFGSRGFRVVFATRLYGYFASEMNLDAATEFERDRTYFAEHHLDVPVAVTDRVVPVVKDGVVTYTPGPDPNDTAYKVGGIPQIHLIDRQGRIRLIMVGYDDANEPRLAKLIEELLAGR